MPDKYLDELSEQERASMWRQSLANEPRHRATRLVGVSDDGLVVGFALAGPSGGDPDGDEGELYAINVDPDHWGTGLGSALLEAATEALRAADFLTAVLWVHPLNARARAFYETRGWRSDEVQRQEEFPGVTVAEIRYSTPL